ncbi:hypothetical protein ACJX0J_025276, partial [Zea mays]
QPKTKGNSKAHTLQKPHRLPLLMIGLNHAFCTILLTGLQLYFQIRIWRVSTLFLHMLALNVHIYLQMNRTDHAKKQLRVMQQLDEDHTLTQLTNAWVDLVLGGSKIQEARLIFQDLSDKYPTTCTILNGKALCSTHMGNFEDAEGLLLESLNKDAKDTKTLANLTVCSLNLGKPTTRYL